MNARYTNIRYHDTFCKKSNSRWWTVWNQVSRYFPSLPRQEHAVNTHTFAPQNKTETRHGAAVGQRIFKVVSNASCFTKLFSHGGHTDLLLLKSSPLYPNGPKKRTKAAVICMRTSHGSNLWELESVTEAYRNFRNDRSFRFVRGGLERLSWNSSQNDNNRAYIGHYNWKSAYFISKLRLFHWFYLAVLHS